MGISRRALLRWGAGGLGLAALPVVGQVPALADPGQAATAVPRPAILPRSAWAKNSCPVKGKLRAETDVRFLVVHHTAGKNGYSRSEVPAMLRGWYRYHTGGVKGWPDLAYNFLIDSYGRIWEGRAGSLAAAVRGSATGGSQGFDQKICFIGSFGKTKPSKAALAAGIELIAWLSAVYEIDLEAGATITFTSRGSNRWKKGRRVRTRPVVGHRDMSLTSCPGDKLYPLIGSLLTPKAAAIVRSHR